jgi:hypothetical protein
MMGSGSYGWCTKYTYIFGPKLKFNYKKYNYKYKINIILF